MRQLLIISLVLGFRSRNVMGQIDQNIAAVKTSAHSSIGYLSSDTSLAFNTLSPSGPMSTSPPQYSNPQSSSATSAGESISIGSPQYSNPQPSGAASTSGSIFSSSLQYSNPQFSDATSTSQNSDSISSGATPTGESASESSPQSSNLQPTDTP